MATVNFETKEISAKVVYFGSQATGCNQLVRNIHEALGPENPSELLHFAKEGENYSWLFHHREGGAAEINGCEVRYEIYSLPREVSSPTHRRQVVQDADLFVVFMDARPDFESNNLDTLINLEQELTRADRDMTVTPVLLKVTHMDGPLSRPAEEVAYSVNPHGYGVLSYSTTSIEARLRLHNEVVATLSGHLKANLRNPNDSQLTLTPVQEKPRPIQRVLSDHLDAFKQANESTQSSLDQPKWSPEDFDTLDSTSRVVLPFEVEGCPDHRPSELISAAIDRGHVHLDLILDDQFGGQPQRAHVVLTYRSDEYERSRSTSTGTEDDSDPVTGGLPMTIEITRAKPGNLNNVGLSFGVIVLTAGTFLGLGFGFLLWY
jgi:mutual gliding-motility protein MglA